MLRATRSMQLRTRGAKPSSSDDKQETKAKPKRRALGNVSNNTLLTRESHDQGKSGSQIDKPVVPQRKSRKTKDHNEPDENTAPQNDGNQKQLPPKRRSLRSFVLAPTKQETTSQQSKAKPANALRLPTRSRAAQQKSGGSEGVSQSVKRPPELPPTEPEAKRPKRSADSSKPVAVVTSQAASAPTVRGKSRLAPRDLQSSLGASEGHKWLTRDPRSLPLRPRNVCKDLLLDADYKLVREPFDASKYTTGIAPHDEHNKENSLEVSEYVTDIFQRLFNAETKTRPDAQYIERQREINGMMRAILVDWLVEVHMKFRLVPETLYLCVNIIDRYCSRTVVERRSLQLVGVTALLVACKYEEIYPPEVRDCVYITDRAYSRQEVLDMEQDIVKQLEFKMTVPTAYPFLTRFMMITKASSTAKIAASYYAERTLQEYEFLQFRPSVVASAAVCLALNNPDVLAADETGNRPGIPQVLLDYTGFTVAEIRACASLIVATVRREVTTATRRKLVAVKKKYESRKYQYISTEFTDPEISDLYDRV